MLTAARRRCRIAAHTAPSNLRVRVHLPLLVPEPHKCGIRVADETRTWSIGEALVFDDAFEHEVWNDGETERVVLLLDLWHPDLSQAEIASIRSMFEAVDEIQQERKRAG